MFCRIFIRNLCFWLAVSSFCAAPNAIFAHSGKARFHIIIDTDGAADDLRTICMLLGNHEAEILSITTSAGALPTEVTAGKVSSLLEEFHHEGIPVGCGRNVEVAIPIWRTHSEKIAWASSSQSRHRYPDAPTLLARTLEEEEQQVTIIALGALTGICDMLESDPALGKRIKCIIWYNTCPDITAGANYASDSISARKVIDSGINMAVVSECRQCPVAISEALIDSIENIPTPYAAKIVETHRAEPLKGIIGSGHLKAWDDLTAVYLFAPELFESRPVGKNVTYCILSDSGECARAQKEIISILRGRTDSESRVFYGFPTDESLYAQDVVPIIRQTVEKYGPSEWRAGVLTNELHGHLGIYATIGVKMGIRAREYFDIGVDDILVTSYAGKHPPVSCMNDGLQVSTGATVGHGLITVADVERPRPEAAFEFKDKTIRLSLKPQYEERIRKDVQKGVQKFGTDSEEYWQYIRDLALQYWSDFDRHEIFDIRIEK